MKLPTLYKKTSTGAQQEWEVWTEGNAICTRWGQTSGAMQTGRDVITFGKNVGKANATTPVEQAEREALALWEKKKKNRGYVETPAAAMAGERDTLCEGGLDVMLAHRFDEHGHKIVYPAYVQPKLDGHRCIALVDDGRCTLWSRTRKPITSVPHIARAVEVACRIVDRRCWAFDGELYAHGPGAPNFETLSSFIRQQTPLSGHEVVEYHVYDAPRDPSTFRNRNEDLAAVFGQLAMIDFGAAHPRCPLVHVETFQVAGEAELLAAFDRFRAQGYEGAIVRNAAGVYVGKRSQDLLKVKSFDDEEFIVAGVERGRGKLADCAIFVCETETGARFTTKMVGALADLKRYVEDPSLAIGQRLTVKFQGRTAAGLPRFPIGLRFRDGS